MSSFQDYVTLLVFFFTM